MTRTYSQVKTQLELLRADGTQFKNLFTVLRVKGKLFGKH